ncbi:ATP-binding protein [Frankia sp. Cas4]|uniref:ATP-binding protein n=1 Tax=Frankia sp. Cas4 TaxID=3073927 RepID=UPI002AD2F784|nr:ATP-binding protein [Frankia sp. Cas4]
MTDIDRWEAANDAYLAAVLHWLRLLLAFHAGEYETDQHERATPADRPPVAPTPPSSEPLALAPSEPVSTSEPRRRGWHRRLPSDTPAAPAAPASIPPPGASTPGAAPPDPAPDAGEPTVQLGQVVTAEDVERAATDMRAAEQITPPPAALQLAQLLGLTDFEREALLLCAGMELDPTMAARCARAQGNPRLTYPTFALAMRALADPAWDVLSTRRGLRWWRLVEISQSAGEPLVTSALRIDERIVNYLKGLNVMDDRVEPLVAPIDADLHPDPIPLPESHRAVLREIIGRWRWGQPRAVHPIVELVGADTGTKRLLATEAAGSVGLALYRLRAETIPGHAVDLETLRRLWSREAVLLGAALYVDAEDTDPGSETAGILTRFLARLDGVVFLGVRQPWVRSERAGVAVLAERPTRAEQRDAWVHALRGTPDSAGDPLVSGAVGAAVGAAVGPAVSVPDLLAGQFNLGLATIGEIARSRLADDLADDPADDPGEPVDPDDPWGAMPGHGRRLWDACLATTRDGLDALAERIEPRARWAEVVLPDSQLALLGQLADQVRRRALVYDDWGFAARSARGLGISALFAGPSGTGKTMAAEVLARQLRLNLYRIDLSAVVSKYIGETEKNLRKLFDAAEQGGALLFFDEADALFGRRSEVKDSHDRYANIEVNYLLQRMESYRGLAVLATNMRGALDQAFLRRLRFVVTFPFPDAELRRRLWATAFPPVVPAEELDLSQLARLPATGGMIRNIAINAAFTAARSGGPVTMPIVLAAARVEFDKHEIPVPERDLAPGFVRVVR